MPGAERIAPPVAAELSQPRPDPLGGFPQGHAITPPTPGSHRLVKPISLRSRMNTSSHPFVSPETRFLAKLVNATKRPSAEIERPSKRLLSSFPCAQPEERLNRSVVPIERLRTKTSVNPFVSPGTRLVAKLANAT